MRKIILTAFFALMAIPAVAQDVQNPGPCSTFGTTATTCAAGNISPATVASGATGATPTVGDSSTKISTTAFGLGGPSFSASRTTSVQTFSSATYTAMIFNAVSTNIGAYYNTSTGKFTPLVSGTYGCSGAATFNTSGTFATAENVIVALSKNGTIGGTGVVQNLAQSDTVATLTQSNSVVIPLTLIAMNGTTDTAEIDANVTTATGSPGLLTGYGTGFTCVRVSQ